ncbi:hypothetical protein IQ265_21645 [Nodosilinea sp. LEGE 06152]|uniref:hypothetical protein n=1 Tax=Nodosilinea sp. LEGE 06152 TaxID=2777966 RepID=UPI00187ED9D6|nr:hypothetical protein [Nodosilinea sp. LEGE 06152]MBE9159412.1 hypothetical protein [Nodosilinea sp. LEGE 06152]
MTSNYHDENDENQQAEALDNLITAQQQGRSLPAPKSLPSAKSDLVADLISHSKDIHPDPGFVASLEAELLQRQSLLMAQPQSTHASNSSSGPQSLPIAQLPTPSTSKRGSRPMRLTNPFRSAQQSLVTLALLVVAVATIATPLGRSLALEFIHVFNQTRSDQVGQQDNSPNAQPRSLTPSELAALQAEVEAEIRETTTVAEMEAERGIELKEPSFIPDGFELKEVVSPFSEIVALNYRNTQTNARFIVTQQRLTANGSPIVGPITLAASSESDSQISLMWSKEPILDDDPALAGGSPIGASAETEPIRVGSVLGEYVEGTWAEVISPDGGIQGMQWTDDTNFRQIQWREGEVLFQVVTPNAMDQEELAAIARSLR